MSEAASESTTTEVTATETTEVKATPEKDWQAEADKWKKLSRDNEAKAKANAEAAQRLAQIEEANASETEKAVAAARKEGESAAIERANSRLVRAEARALAAELGFTDPTDAVALIDLSQVTVNDEGDVDSEAVRKELADLAERKKYLLKSARDTSGYDAGIGAAGDKPKPGTKAADLAQIEADLAAAGRRR